MADTAAFFAKKKKKKAFKFNANNIDVSKAISTVHIDAPAVSSEMDNTSTSLSSLAIKEPKTFMDIGGGDWDDNNDTAQQQKKQSTATISGSNGNGSGPAELMDMKTFDKKRNEQDDIAERMRVEETKAKLAAAKAGMEKEAQRLKEEQEMKKSKINSEVAPSGSRFGLAANNMSGGMAGRGEDGKWVPPHMRQAARQPAPSSMGGGFRRPVDAQDENLFPDLATADRMIAKEEEEKLAAAAAIEAANATKKTKKPKEVVDEPKEEVVVEKQPETNKEEAKPVTPSDLPPKDEPAPAPPASVGAGLVKKKKKKKKDLSTFKAS